MAIYPLLGTLGTLISNTYNIDIIWIIEQINAFYENIFHHIPSKATVIFWMNPLPPVSSYVIFSDTPTPPLSG